MRSARAAAQGRQEDLSDGPGQCEEALREVALDLADGRRQRDGQAWPAYLDIIYRVKSDSKYCICVSSQRDMR